MLNITSDTMTTMEQASEAGFRDRLATFIAQRFPEHARDRVALAAVVDTGVADARGMGLRSERGLAAYVVAAFLLGMDINEDPNLIRELRDSGENEAAKIDWIEGYVAAVAEALEG